MYNRYFHRWRCTLALGILSLAIPLPGYPLDLIPDFDWFKSDRDKAKTLWQVKEQSVRIEPQGRVQGQRPPSNDHPVELSPTELREVLAVILVSGKSSFFDGFFKESEEPVPVFTAYEVSILSKMLAEGLAKAKPDQDVTFAVVGIHKAFFFTKEQVAIGGRVFFKDHKLNIIFGDLHQPVRTASKDVRGVELEVDRRLYPIKVGSREEAKGHDWRIVNLAGQSFYTINGGTRGDWLVIDMPVMLAAIHKKQNALPKAVAKEAERSRLEAQRLSAERRQMREELARMRKEMRDLGKTGGAREPYTKTLEERLATLEKLKDKKLITDKEYEAKRREILNDI